MTGEAMTSEELKARTLEGFERIFNRGELWHVWDTLLLARQLGAPAPDLSIGAPASTTPRAP